MSPKFNKHLYHSNLTRAIFSHTAERMCLLVRPFETSMITDIEDILGRG